MFDDFEMGVCKNDEDLKGRHRVYPFYRHAANCWIRHAFSTRTADLPVDLLQKFLGPDTTDHWDACKESIGLVVQDNLYMGELNVEDFDPKDGF